MHTREITKTVYKISDFLAWQKGQLLILSPYFQRRSVWSLGAKSYLLDTVVRGLPIPIIFLREQKTDLTRLEHKREVVDGQQRLRTILSFIQPKSLPNYNAARDAFQIQEVHNKALADRDFKDFPVDVKQRILDYEFSVHILPSSIDDREVLQIFARMNATGYKLNPQELRNAAYFGQFKTSVFDLAAEQLQRWRKWRLFNEDQIARMNEVELTSEFAQMMLRGIVGKSQKALNSLYEEKNVKYPEKQQVERRFRLTMDSTEEIFGDELSGFNTRPRFFGLFTFLYDITFGLESDLVRAKPTPLPSGIQECLSAAAVNIENRTAPAGVLGALAKRTTHPRSRRTVISYLKRTCGIG
jgi:uncharacterized protein DUF262